MTARSRVTFVFAALALVCVAGQALTVRKVDALRPEATLEEVLYIPSAKALQRMSLGYSGLVADIYWTRAVQYFGRKHGKSSNRYELLYPLLDITTTLDPHLIPAYEFGSTFLAQKPPQGAGQPDKAVALLQKGVAQNQDEWKLYLHLGFVYYFEIKDYLAASRALEHAADMPGGNPDLHAIAGTLAQHGGDLETSRQLWLMVYNNEKQDQLRKNAARHLAAIDNDQIVTVLEAAINDYRRRMGRDPRTWAEMNAAGYGRTVPIDPQGDAYKLIDGRVEVAHPETFPFITKGLPPGEQPSIGPQIVVQ
jgi:tetratricopeptide (TPR) repeat protein